METGLDPDRFWTLTPRQVQAELSAAVVRRRDHQNELLWAAWHMAAFYRMEKLPDLKKLMGEQAQAPAKRRKRPWQEIAAEGQAWVTRSKDRK